MKIFIYLFQSMRPRQWTKNLVIFAGLIFSKNLVHQAYVEKSIEAFVVFCMLSGMIYLINDLADKEKDELHETKKHRPIPSGKLKASHALASALIVTPFALYWALSIGRNFFAASIIFIAFNMLYSFILKKVVLLDVLSISISFLIRAIAGVEALNDIHSSGSTGLAQLHSSPDSIQLSPWLLICTLFLSLFLGFCKRRYELISMEEASLHRESLSEYSSRLLDQLVGISASGAVFSYSIYTIWPETVDKFQTQDLIYTIPFVLLGIMRYLYLVYSKDKGGCPSELLLTEKFLLIDVFIWVVLVIAIIFVF